MLAQKQGNYVASSVGLPSAGRRLEVPAATKPFHCWHIVWSYIEQLKRFAAFIINNRKGFRTYKQMD